LSMIGTCFHPLLHPGSDFGFTLCRQEIFFTTDTRSVGSGPHSPSHQPATHNLQPTTFRTTIHHLPLTTYHLQHPTIHHSPFTIYQPPPLTTYYLPHTTSHHSPFTIYHLPTPTTYHLLPTTYNIPPFTIHHSPLTIHPLTDPALNSRPDNSWHAILTAMHFFETFAPCFW